MPGADAPLIHPVLLSGGSGTRLWPVSRRDHPKQFARLTGAESLFQASARRLSGPGFAAPLVTTGSEFRFVVAGQLAECELSAAAILLEPEPRGTAPALLAAVLWLAARDPGALLLAAPSDHVIPDAEGFRAAVRAAVPAARAGRIVTFGITPDRAETGYGWLEPEPQSRPDPGPPAAAPVSVPGSGRAADPGGKDTSRSGEDRPDSAEIPLLDPEYGAADPAPGGLPRLVRFVEKPDAGTAARMLAEGRHLWNAGIFLASAATLRAAFARHAPQMLAAVERAVREAVCDLGFTRLAPSPWAGITDISVDYAVMEKADNLSVMPYAGAWSDLGGWDALWRESGPDAAGMVTQGNVLSLGCEGSLLRSESGGLELVGIGLRDVIAVAMPDAVLVADRARAGELRSAVAALKARGAPQATGFARSYRPWGWYESLATGPGFQVKRIVVEPGGRLSLQSHRHRAEHWVVVGGTARVTLDGAVRLLEENRSVYIPQGAVHRLENPGRRPLVVIEVQTGSYLGEDDILRLEDAYARGPGGAGTADPQPDGGA